MKILINGINFSPELTGIGKYTGEMAEWLAAQGHQVRVVTAPPYYPQWCVAAGHANLWSTERVNISESAYGKSAGGLKVYRCPLWVPAIPSGLKRVVHLASFALSSFPVMLWQILWHPDVVLVVEPPLFCAPHAWLVAKLGGGRAWLHIQDFEVDAAFDLGFLKGARLRRIFVACEKVMMRRFDRVSTVSQRMFVRALAKGVSPDRMVYFPNWVDVASHGEAGQLNVHPNIRNCIAYRVELGIAADAVVALYSGNMGGKQGLEIMAQAAELLREESGVVFVFCGDGSERDSLKEQCAGLMNVIFIDFQPLERFGELLGMVDIHLLPQRADAADLVMPSKLTGMLASGRPIVATAQEDTELANVVSGCGFVVEPGQPQAFADAIMELANSPALRAQLGASGRYYAEEHLDQVMVLGRFEAELKELRNSAGCMPE
ncbi:MAG: glycosyltransferase WbuB [Gallionella sp.]